MAVVINGTTGITSVNGSASAPSVTGTDTDTGIVYGTNTLSLATGGTTAVTVDSSQQVTFSQAANLPNTFGFKNRVINGNMGIDQRNAGASVTATNAGLYTVDRWQSYNSVASSKFTVRQTPSATETGYATRVGAGFTNYLACTSSSSYSIGSADYFVVYQKIEGFNFADMAWGTSNAKTITLSFWAYSSLTGTFGGSLQNSAQNRNYVFSYSIPTANTWTQISVTITGDTTGTWIGATNGIGAQVFFSLGAGSGAIGAAGSWGGTALFGVTGQTNVVATSGATFYITGVQLEKGSTATSFDYRPYGTELMLCQRYYQLVSNFIGYGISATVINGMVTANSTMRTTPTFGQTGVYYVSDYYSLDHVQSAVSIGLFNGTAAGGAIGLGNFSSVTGGRVYLTRFLNSNQITLSAEL